MKRYIVFLFWALAWAHPALAQDWTDFDDPGPLDLSAGLRYRAEVQASASRGATPLWLNANRQGLSSLEELNGYVRGSLLRPLQTDSARRWGVGYGLDLALPIHYTSHAVVQQAFVEGRWLHGAITIGAKENRAELKNQRLSSGAQTLGINARPVPQIRLSLPDYWRIPLTRGWLHLKGHLAYGRLTDDSWQHDFSQRRQKYTDGTLYHSKAGYLKLGNDDVFFPLSIEAGLEMAAQFGGKCYIPQADGTVQTLEGTGGLHGMWRAFWPGGGDVGETTYQNAEGNQLGSWVLRINYDADTWRFSVYADKYFEDHSAMLLLDYDGYGQGDEWQEKQKRRYLMYDLKDMMLGMELNFKYSRWLRDVVVEYLYTKYQSGPIYHDHTQTIADHIGGVDNYYNHFFYSGWQHWGQVIGNPLYRSPIYNENGQLYIQSNRFMAFHTGISGEPADNFWYRVLATWQESLGTYDQPYTKKHHNVSTMVELGCSFRHQWQLTAAFGMDAGSLLGHNYGAQLTLRKSGLVKKNRKAKK